MSVTLFFVSFHLDSNCLNTTSIDQFCPSPSLPLMPGRIPATVESGQQHSTNKLARPYLIIRNNSNLTGKDLGLA